MCITPNKTTFVAIEWRNWGKPIQAVNKIVVLCWTIQQPAEQPTTVSRVYHLLREKKTTN